MASKDDSGGPVNNRPPPPEAHLEHDQFLALIDILRRNFLYQEPLSAYPKGREPKKGQDPEFLILRIKPDHWRAMMLFISNAGGWTLPRNEAQRIEVVKTIREAKARAHHDVFGNDDD